MRKFPSKYDGQCDHCDETFTAGTPILYVQGKVLGCPACDAELRSEARLNREVQFIVEVTAVRYTTGEFTICVVQAREARSEDFPETCVDVKAPFSVKGNFVASVGDILEVAGKWEHNARYGWGLSATTAIPLIDSEDVASVETILRRLKGVGTKLASAIIAAFGHDEVFSILDNAPHRLAEVRGISLDSVAQIQEDWVRLQAVREAHSYIGQLGLKPYQIRDVFDLFGEDTRAIIELNPYALIRVESLNFAEVDEIARTKYAIDFSDERRLAAAVAQIVRDYETGWHGGHTSWIIS